MKHIPVLMNEVLSFVPARPNGKWLDVTAGGGGHFLEVYARHRAWRGECWDRDPAAEARVRAAAEAKGLATEWDRHLFFERRVFGDEPPADKAGYDFILADIGVSSFQLDDPTRGLSFHSPQAPDFRMDPESGVPFEKWLAQTPEFELARIFEDYGEEPKAKRIAREMKSWRPESFASAEALAAHVAKALGYKGSRTHPATRVFQALRIAINDELGELTRLLRWAPARLAPGGRLAVISFHSLEDRIVKNAFRGLAADGGFDILTKKPVVPGQAEETANPRARSSKLRVLERGQGDIHENAGEGLG